MSSASSCAAEVAWNLHLAYPSHVQPAAARVSSPVVSEFSSLNVTLHRLVLLLHTASGTLAYRKLRQLARCNPHLVMGHLPVLAALFQTTATEPLAAWSRQAQNNGKASAAANLMLQLLGVLDMLRPHLFKALPVLVPLLQELISALLKIVSMAAADTQLAQLLEVVVALLREAFTSGHIAVLDAIQPQLNELYAQTRTAVPAAADELLQLLQYEGSVPRHVAAEMPTEKELTVARCRLRGIASVDRIQLQLQASTRDWMLAESALTEVTAVAGSQPSLLQVFVLELVELTAICPCINVVQGAYQLLVRTRFGFDY